MATDRPMQRSKRARAGACTFDRAGHRPASGGGFGSGGRTTRVVLAPLLSLVLAPWPDTRSLFTLRASVLGRVPRGDANHAVLFFTVQWPTVWLASIGEVK